MYVYICNIQVDLCLLVIEFVKYPLRCSCTAFTVGGGGGGGGGNKKLNKTR